jgi:hypothetical protein
LLKLLAPIPPRLDWPSYPTDRRLKGARVSDGPATAFQLEHVRELHNALARILPDVARASDPTTVKTKKDATAFIAGAMTALHTRAGYA